MNQEYVNRKSNSKKKYSSTYEPIFSSDIFNQLPPKQKQKKKSLNDYNKKYDLYYNTQHKEDEYYNPPLSYNSNSNYSKHNTNEINTIGKLRRKNTESNETDNSNQFKTTYNSSYKLTYISKDNVVGNDKNLGTGVAYNSRKKKIDFLKSNIFCDEDKYNQNSYLVNNFDPKSINHNNWCTNLDWRNGKTELVFFKNNQKEFYDNTSSANKNAFQYHK